MSDFSSVAQQQSNLNQSQAFAAALQRAKQIAAKIQPNSAQQQQQQGGAAGFKRSHDDSDSGPDTKRFTSPGSDYSGGPGGHNTNSNMSTGSGGGGGGGGNGSVTGVSTGAPANMSQALAQAAAVAARLAATAGTTCEEQVRIPENIVQAVLGRGSNDTITHIQAESGCKVQLPQEQGDRVVTLRGSRETVTKARDMIQQLSNRNGGGNLEVVLTINMPPPGPTGYPPYQEVMIPGTKVGLVIGKGGDTIKQLQEKTGAKMVIIQEGPNQEVIKPLRISGDPQKIEHAKQLVLDLIAQKEAQAQSLAGRNPAMGGGMGSNGGFGGTFGAGGEQCEVFVPKVAVGVVIGKGGDMIRKIQLECGCKLQFIQGKNDEPGDRRCLIQGTHQQVDDAKRMIEGLIENVMNPQQRNRNAANGAGGNTNGMGDAGNSNYGYGYGVNHAQQVPREEITFMVPSSKCGIVIGRGGETIKLINQQSGAYCEMDRNAVNPPNEKLFKCKGTSEQVEAARQLISEKINMELPIISRKPISGNIPNHQNNYNQNAMQGDPSAAVAAAAAAYQQHQWGNYAQQGGWGDQQQQQQQMAAPGAAASSQQQADYSQQWIEYYKSMGMHREAEMIESQLKAKQAAAAAAAAQQMSSIPQQQHHQPQQQQQQGQAASGQQAQDYSAQWAEYYRSIGKIEEAEAIEKQMKGGQPNPSANTGVNANTNSMSNPGTDNTSNQTPAGGPTGGGGASAAMPQQQQQPQPGGYPQGMTPTQYAQYSQYYAAAAAQAGQGQPPGAGGPGGYPQQAYGGYGAPAGYPGAPQMPGMPGGMGGPGGAPNGGPNGNGKPKGDN